VLDRKAIDARDHISRLQIDAFEELSVVQTLNLESMEFPALEDGLIVEREPLQKRSRTAAEHVTQGRAANRVRRQRCALGLPR
jgi:hypothetical protein